MTAVASPQQGSYVFMIKCVCFWHPWHRGGPAACMYIFVMSAYICSMCVFSACMCFTMSIWLCVWVDKHECCVGRNGVAPVGTSLSATDMAGFTTSESLLLSHQSGEFE